MVGNWEQSFGDTGFWPLLVCSASVAHSIGPHTIPVCRPSRRRASISQHHVPGLARVVGALQSLARPEPPYVCATGSSCDLDAAFSKELVVLSEQNQ